MKSTLLKVYSKERMTIKSSNFRPQTYLRMSSSILLLSPKQDTSNSLSSMEQCLLLKTTILRLAMRCRTTRCLLTWARMPLGGRACSSLMLPLIKPCLKMRHWLISFHIWLESTLKIWLILYLYQTLLKRIDSVTLNTFILLLTLIFWSNLLLFLEIQILL